MKLLQKFDTTFLGYSVCWNKKTSWKPTLSFHTA